ncbi:winged helix-turn-helix domain-containing protein [Methanococcoides sp. SA1]|nr:winged helix-turn-helix domain-containing protein [Methanococcoides sp. SA1]
MPMELIETIFLSEKRENLLLMLLNDPADIKTIDSTLSVTSSSILPQIKKLRDVGFIDKNESGSYVLTSIGRLVAENMKPLSGMLNVFDVSCEYWDQRDLTTIPDHLLDNIGNLGNIQLIVPDLDHMYELQDEFLKNMQTSGKVSSVLSLYHPDNIELLNEMEAAEIKIKIIVTESVLERMLNDSEKEMEALLSSDNTTIFVCEDTIKPPSFSITDTFLYMSLFDIHGRYDHHDIMSFEDSALEWGEMLFEHYQNLSSPIE